MLDSKLYFHRHVEYLPSQGLNLLGLMHFITNNFSSLDRQKNIIYYPNLFKA
jgi:hypothetical protein